MNPTLKASLWMIGAVLSFSLLAVAGRELKGHLDTFEIMLYRSVVGVVLTGGAAVLAGRLASLKPQRMGLQLARNVVHFTGQNLWFYAVTVAPLAQVFALEFTMPVWALLLAVPLLHEALTRRRVITVAVGFLGILIVTRPWIYALGPGVIEAALSAIAFGATVVLTRRLTRDVPILAILFWLSVMQGIFALVLAGYDGRIALPQGAALAWVVAIGFGGMLAHLCLTTALSLAPASVVIPIDFARLPLIAVVAAILYSEGIDIWVLIGAAIIFGANYVNILHEAKAR